MEKNGRFERPLDLQKGRNYFLRLSINNNYIPLFTQVAFLGYTGCPAVVVVQDLRKVQLRCSRDDLFSYLRYSHPK